MTMKKILLSLTAAATVLSCSAAPAASGDTPPVNLIPQPSGLEVKEGSYTFDRFDVAGPEDPVIRRFFDQYITPSTGIPVRFVKDNKANIHLIVEERIDYPDTPADNELALDRAEYSLMVDGQGATIVSRSGEGLFYALQTLRQLLPSQIKSPVKVGDIKWSVPQVSITDRPAFAWRGMHLDVSRHFFTKEEVMRYIDQMAEYKMNVFHWHLTDDQGWRIEIESLPRLTGVGAWRAPRVGNWWTREPQRPGEAATYGGFYTHEDIKEVLAYAAERFITVIPEIDVPGHSLAALVAYPELACAKAPAAVNVGNKFYEIDENTLCVGNNAVVLAFMDKVLTEVAELFPAEYIHIGGDECTKVFWKKCPKCQALMKAKGLKNENELQSYFIRQMETLLKSKGKKLIGWDEILEGGLAPEATVMSWRGTAGGVEAARQGHHVIMTPAPACYIDLYQGEPSVEPDTYSMARLSDSYGVQLVPEGVSRELILGGQANLWAESVPTFRHAEYMAWPRGWALAERFWSGDRTENDTEDWAGFVRRVEAHFARAKAADINYAPSVYDAYAGAWNGPNGELIVELNCETPDAEIYYSFDNTIPDLHGLRYTGPVALPLNASRVTVATYRDGQPLGRVVRVETPELQKRAKRTKPKIGNL